LTLRAVKLTLFFRGLEAAIEYTAADHTKKSQKWTWMITQLNCQVKLMQVPKTALLQHLEPSTAALGIQLAQF
jgi:hypothetical protein